ncbi:MAG: efflux RND transporter periplasmic adaptor subunit [Nibricoccus sp.]
MKTLSVSVALTLSSFLAAPLQAADSARNASTIVLDATGVKNLRIQTAVVEEADFEESVFSLGRIETRPGNVAAVSSRISGRIVALNAFPGDRIEAGAEVAKVESRQPGNPSPVISLTAPIGGIVSHLDVRLGDPVEPDKALLEISDLSEVYAIARVPESIAGRLKPSAKAHITVSAWPDEKLEGDLLRFGTAADVASGTIDAIFRLPNREGRLRPGMRAEFSIVVSKRSGVVAVPRSAIQGELSKRFVYVKDFDLPNAFVKTPVVVGQSNDRSTEIVSGLLPADEVVTQGAYSLAFAGGGSVSLKEALDAAHGHAHAEDGSELKESSAKSAGSAGEDHGHDHDHDHADGGSNPFWMIVSGVLFVLLLIVSLRKRTGPANTSTVAPKPNTPAK